MGGWGVGLSPSLVLCSFNGVFHGRTGKGGGGGARLYSRIRTLCNAKF